MSESLTTLRRKLAQQLGGFGTFTASGGSASTIVCANAFLSSILPTSHLAFVWVYVPGLTYPNQRRVTSTGLTPGSGTLTLDGSLGASVSNGTPFEIHTHLPAAREGVAAQALGLTIGAHECLNLALRHILVEDDSLSLALVNGQYDYALSSWPWLNQPGRLLDVREPNVLGTTYVSARRRWEFREGAQGNTLHFPGPYRFGSGSYTARLVALRPADTLIKVGGTWGNSTTGLVNESDEAAPPINDVIIVALAFAYRALMQNKGGAARAKYADLYAEQVREARRVRNYDKSNDIDPSIPDVPAPPEAA